MVMHERFITVRFFLSCGTHVCFLLLTC